MNPYLQRLLLFANGFDTATTLFAYYLSGKDLGIELNPLMRAALWVSPLFFLGIKLVLTEIGSSMLMTLPGKFSTAGLVACNAIYVALVFYQLHLMTAL